MGTRVAPRRRGGGQRPAEDLVWAGFLPLPVDAGDLPVAAADSPVDEADLPWAFALPGVAALGLRGLVTTWALADPVAPRTAGFAPPLEPEPAVVSR